MDRAQLLNRLINRPDVLPDLAPGYDFVDMAKFFEHPWNVMVGDDRWAALFAYVEDGVYEGHYIMPAGIRPRRAIELARHALNVMFTSGLADRIVGHTPIDNAPARALSRALGFAPTGTSVSSTGRSCVDYVMERSTWAILSAESSAASDRSAAQLSRLMPPKTLPSRR